MVSFNRITLVGSTIAILWLAELTRISTGMVEVDYLRP